MIEFKEVSKVYEDNFEVLKNINLRVNKGELLVLIGPSGCGKTTTMKMINRLIAPTKGEIFINGNSIKHRNPVELRRNIGYVIQQIGLFPHMTIQDNIALVPKLKKQDPKKYLKRVDELLEMVGLDPEIYKNRYPTELSGGQQQRIGVIRALAADPPIILMDEPFSALDPISREQLQDELLNLHNKLDKTIVFVTHDMDEALKIADRICIMREGEIVQLNTAEEILRHPANDFVKNFIGEKRLKSYNGFDFPPIDEFISKAITIREDKGLAEAINQLRQNRVDSLIVVNKSNQYKGVASSWDIYRNYNDEKLKIKDIVRTDYACIKENDSVEKALIMIKESNKGYVLVLDDNKKVKGVITNGSLVKLLANKVINDS